MSLFHGLAHEEITTFTGMALGTVKSHIRRALRQLHDVLDEECLLLEGDAFIGDTLLRTGDWQLAPTGSKSRLITTDKGALVFMHSTCGRTNIR